MLTPSPSRRNTALRAYSALRAHQRVQPAPQPGLLADAAYREQRARDVGRGRVAGVVADGEAFVGGAENRLAQMREASLVLTRYGSEDEAWGVLGVLGPTRLPYWRAVPMVRFMAELMDVVNSRPGL